MKNDLADKFLAAQRRAGVAIMGSATHQQDRRNGGDSRLHDARHKAAPPENRGGGGLIFDRVSDVAPQPINWLWEGRLARGKITLAAGDPGLGKSQLAIDIVARLSMGTNWPDFGSAPVGSAIILSAEDSVSDTLRPRLEVADADLSRVHVLRSVVGADGARRTFSLQSDLRSLEDKFNSVGDVGLVVTDPVTSYMGKVDSHRTTDVRAVLEPLAEFAERFDVAVLAITHPPKATQAKAMHAVTGSLAFVAAARLVFIVVEEPETERRLLLPVKSNIGPMPLGLGFNVVGASTAGGISTSHIVWSSDPVTITANQALHAASEDAKGDGALREAEDFLREALRDGAASVKEIEKAASALGIKQRTLDRARKRLKVKAGKDGSSGGWRIWLPEEGQP